jgi:2-C-methyl-D-erythritol 4-phosphate cytidylyltransferase
MDHLNFNKWVVITAGGSGLRMGTHTPKQFLEIGDKPILSHTIHSFQRALPEINIVLVLPSDKITYWENQNKAFKVLEKCQIITGGKTRFESVKNGLNAISDRNSLIAVHDGVRPLISSKLIQRVFEGAANNGNAIPVIPIQESLRKMKGTTSKIVDRESYKIVQTPQCFQAQQLLSSFEADYDESFTDEASVVEKAGHEIHLVEGEPMNIKITTPFDLENAAKFIKES